MHRLVGKVPTISVVLSTHQIRDILVVAKGLTKLIPVSEVAEVTPAITVANAASGLTKRPQSDISGSSSAGTLTSTQSSVGTHFAASTSGLKRVSSRMSEIDTFANHLVLVNHNRQLTKNFHQAPSQPSDKKEAYQLDEANVKLLRMEFVIEEFNFVLREEEAPLLKVSASVLHRAHFSGQFQNVGLRVRPQQF